MRTVVLPSEGRGTFRPVDASDVRVESGFWADRLGTNRGVTIPHGHAMLEASGALANFRHAARGSGTYIGGLDDAGITFPFLDSDVYKWLEAVGWELGREHDARIHDLADPVVELVASAQRDDGYLGTFVQLSGRQPYTDLQWGHELYCVGHLTQAAVAWQRSLDDDRLVTVARRAIDHIDGALGADGRAGIDGHPEIEMALVELFRTTGEERFLGLAQLLVERRGRGHLGAGRLGSRYWQDHLPVREAPTVVGHAVRQLYLDCGVVDVAVETADEELLAAVVRRWEDMWATRTYLTGALGAHHRDEAFGDAFELPPDRAYAETCAAIASVMLAWRLLLATGEAQFAEAIERTLFNAVLPGLALDGRHFFYTNPLQLRDRPGARGAAAGIRAEWYPCACCPPNIMRTLSTFEHLLATTGDSGVQVHQYAAGRVAARVPGGLVGLRMETGYPWQGRVEIVVEQTPEPPWSLELRIPDWARGATLQVGGATQPIDEGSRTTRLERAWRAGDRVELRLPVAPRAVAPDPRIDAVRGCLAIERGPLVFCLEQDDLPEGVRVDRVALAALSGSSISEGTAANLPGMPSLHLAGRLLQGLDGGGWPYREATQPRVSTTPLEITAVPYLAWANRTPGPMRIWLPRLDPESREAMATAG